MAVTRENQQELIDDNYTYHLEEKKDNDGKECTKEHFYWPLYEYVKQKDKLYSIGNDIYPIDDRYYKYELPYDVLYEEIASYSSRYQVYNFFQTGDRKRTERKSFPSEGRYDFPIIRDTIEYYYRNDDEMYPARRKIAFSNSDFMITFDLHGNNYQPNIWSEKWDHDKDSHCLPYLSTNGLIKTNRISSTGSGPHYLAGCFSTEEPPCVRENFEPKSWFDIRDVALMKMATFFPPHDNQYPQNKELSERLLEVELSSTDKSYDMEIKNLKMLLNRGYTAAGLSLLNHYKQLEKEEKDLFSKEEYDTTLATVQKQINTYKKGKVAQEEEDSYSRFKDNKEIQPKFEHILDLIQDNKTDETARKLLLSTEQMVKHLKDTRARRNFSLITGILLDAASTVSLTSGHIALGGACAFLSGAFYSHAWNTLGTPINFQGILKALSYNKGIKNRKKKEDKEKEDRERWGKMVAAGRPPRR